MCNTNILKLAALKDASAFATLLELADERSSFVKFTRSGSGLKFTRTDYNQLVIEYVGSCNTKRFKRLNWCDIATNKGLNEMFDSIHEYLITKDDDDFPRCLDIFLHI